MGGPAVGLRATQSYGAPLGKMVEPDFSVSPKDRCSIVVEQFHSAQHVSIIRPEEQAQFAGFNVRVVYSYICSAQSNAAANASFLVCFRNQNIIALTGA